MLRIISASLALTPKDIFHLTPLITPITYKAFPPKLPWQNSPQVSSDLSDLFISLLYSCTLLHSTLKILQLLQSQPSSFGPHSTLPPWVTASISTSSVTSWKSLEFHILIPVFIATNLKWSEVAQLCLTLCDPMDYSLQSSSVHGIFQARVLEWVAISFSRGSSWPRDRTQITRIAGRHFTVWTTREALPPIYHLLYFYFFILLTALPQQSFYVLSGILVICPPYFHATAGGKALQSKSDYIKTFLFCVQHVHAGLYIRTHTYP